MKFWAVLRRIIAQTKNIKRYKNDLIILLIWLSKNIGNFFKFLLKLWNISDNYHEFS